MSTQTEMQGRETGLGRQVWPLVSWRAVWTGVVIAFGVWLLLCAVGLAVAFGIADPNVASLRRAGWWLGAWTVVAGVAGILVGSFSAGWLCGAPRKLDVFLHGVATWAVAILAMLVLASWLLAQVLGGTLRLVRTGASLTAQEAGAQLLTEVVPRAAPEVNQAAQAAERAVVDAVEAAGGRVTQPQELRGAVFRLFATLVSVEAIQRAARGPQEAGKEVLGPQDRQALARTLVQSTTLDEQQALQVVSRAAPEVERNLDEAARRVAGAVQAAGSATESAFDLMRNLLWYSTAFLVLTLLGALLGVLLAMGAERRPPALAPAWVPVVSARPAQEAA